MDAKPKCFSELSRVFPMADDGLRVVSEDCQKTCGMVHACLKEAVHTPQGVAMRAQRMEDLKPVAKGGVSGFLSRWAEMKGLKQGGSRREKQAKK